MQKKILLIHEDQSLCESVRKVLSDTGYKIIQLRKTDEISETIQREKPDALLLDIKSENGLSIMPVLARLGGHSTSSSNSDSAALPNQSQQFEERRREHHQERIITSPPEISSVLHESTVPHESPLPDSQTEAAKQSEAMVTDGGAPKSETATAEKLKEFQNLFLAVKTKYACGLPAKVEALSRDVKAAISQPFENAPLETVRQQSHKLVGTAGSYGYEVFSSSMRHIEQTVLAMLRNPQAADVDKQWEGISRELAKGFAEAERIALEATQPSETQTSEFTAYGPVFAQVLVVDEDARFLDVVEQLGRQINVAVRKASESGQALNSALMHQLDAAIINVKPETCEQAFKLSMDLRSMPGYETLPLAFLSSDATTRPSVEAAHVGASLHLDKSLDVNSLDAAVRHLIAIRQGGRPKVMVVDDDPDFTDKIAFDLRNDNLLVKTVNDPLTILEELQDFPPDVLLLDVMMPGMDGFQTCRMLRGMPRWRDLPIVFITAEVSVEARVKAFTSGGDDYLPKPVVTEELLARVRVRLEKSRLLKERSDKDTITGLLLRRAFVEQINSMLADAERTETECSICLIDVDHFKKVNDTYGHMAGDRVLTGFGQLLLRRFRVDDLRGRWGGEEFIVAFRRENKQTMRAAINRIQEEFSNMAFESDDNRTFSVSFSGGVASFPEDGKTLYELLKVADERLYDAKRAGRRRILISAADSQ